VSKGTKTYAVRLPVDLVLQIGETVERRNLWTREEEWTLSDFIRIALEEKVRKMERSRTARNKKKALSLLTEAVKRMHGV